MAEGSLHQDNCDSSIAPSQVGVVFDFRMCLYKLPRCLVGLRPILAEDAAMDLAALGKFHQSLLHRNANLPADAGRAVTMNKFENTYFLGARNREPALQPLQCFADQRHIGLEVDGFDECARLQSIIIAELWLLA
jgi:hypothetical protein